MLPSDSQHLSAAQWRWWEGGKGVGQARLEQLHPPTPAPNRRRRAASRGHAPPSPPSGEMRKPKGESFRSCAVLPRAVFARAQHARARTRVLPPLCDPPLRPLGGRNSRRQRLLERQKKEEQREERAARRTVPTLLFRFWRHRRRNFAKSEVRGSCRFPRATWGAGPKQWCQGGIPF
eukprot:gene22081-biopygen20707